MAFTASVEVDRLPTASAYTTPPSSSLHLHTLLIPNLDPRASVKSSIKKFIRENLAVPDDLQCISAPLFSVLADQEVVEDIYGRYCCSADAENSELHVDEESFTFFAREKGRHVDLTDDDRLDQRHIIDSCKLHLKVLPQRLPEQGGRIFVEMKNGILPIQGISPRTSVSQIKRTIEKLTGIPSSQQLLSSVGRIMHDEFYVDDFNGLHSIYEDSTLDLCKSGDSNSEQSHRRVPVKVCVKNDVEFIVVVQGRDTVRSIMQLVEARTGSAPHLQKISFSGKILDEKKTLSDCFIYPDCTLQVNIFKKAPRPGMRRISDDDLQEQSADLLMDDERKPLARKIKLVRTLKGSVTGTVTIPVLTTDRIIELRKKIKRSLQPLVERNLSMPTPQREPKHIDITPGYKLSSTNLSNMNSSASNIKPSNCISGSPSSAENVKQTISIRNLTSALSLASNSNKKLAGTRPCLSSGSTPVNNMVQFSSLSSPSPPSAGSSSVSRIPSASASRIHIEHPSECSPLSNKTASARRLHFEPISSNASNVVGKEWDQANRSENHATRSQEASKPENQKRSFGAWINNSVHALTDQIRAQLAENQ